MSNTHFTSSDELMSALDVVMPDQRWRAILQLLGVKGIADMTQMKDAIGLTRDKLARGLDRISEFTLDNSPLISRLLKTIKRPSESNRPSAIYTLAEGGAKLLRQLGFPDAHAFGLTNDDKAVAHVLSMVSVHILAERSGVQISTDRILPYAEGNFLRPDHQITLANGKSFLVEVEQEANSALIERIKESIAHHHQFFTSPASAMYLREVRMLVNVKPGRDFDRTIMFWQTAMLQFENDQHEEINFRIVALPLKTFLDSSEWDEELSDRWTELEAEQGSKSPAMAKVAEMISAFRENQPVIKDLVLLSALAERFEETATQEVLRPNYDMFELMTVIYDATFGHGRFSSVPIASIYLLREYLDRHPKFRASLNQAMHFNQGRMVWSQQNILHRMGIVIRRFLSYYGWSGTGIIKVYPRISDKEPRGFEIFCEIDENSKMTITERVDGERALRWVLGALFEYAQDIGLGRPDFW